MKELITHDSVESYLLQLPQQALSKEDFSQMCNTLFRHLLHLITDGYRMPFNSVFSQIAFIVSEYKINYKVSQALHYYRIFLLNDAHSNRDNDLQNVQIGILSMLNDIAFGKVTSLLSTYQKEAKKVVKPTRLHTEIIPHVRFSILEDHLDEGYFTGCSELEPMGEKKVIVREPNQELVLKSMLQNLLWFELPVTVMLINVRVIQGDYYPECITILPDFLVDVTAIAECFSHDGHNHNLHFLHKLTPKSPSDSLFIGICANTFLDELITDSESEFKDLTPLLFQSSPLFLASKTDDEVRELMQQAYYHYNNLADFVRSDEDNQIKNLSSALIEPSYCSPAYGIQGRLDLFIDHLDGRSIIELKSGRIFKPNNYQINQNHYIQTLLYDLLDKKNDRKDKEVKAFILYSKMDMDRLRYAPPVRSLQTEAIMVRNSLIAIEYRLAMIDANGNDPTNVFDITRQLMKDGVTGFVARDLEKLNRIIDGLNSLEKKYLKAYIGFVAREYFNAKAGMIRNNVSDGQSSLWLSKTSDKLNNHFIMDRMLTEKVVNTGKDTFVTFRKSQMTDRLADFRVGDIVVLYASDEEGNFLWEGRQLFKGTLIANQEEEAVIRLRAKQNRKEIFHKDTFWNIEKDIIDSNFGSQFKSMMIWASADSHRRRLLLGTIPPARQEITYKVEGSDLSPYHVGLLEQALSTRDYFLLWGPPGTGKTSIMAKNIIRILSTERDQRLLVMAYTNRAVDELCAAIESIGPEYKERYIRIGSRFSTAEAYTDNLLDARLADIHNRRQLLELLHSSKIVIGTVASISGKPELLELLSFKWALIDEASQILDPQIVDLLCRVPRFIMIGDHKQLPAVVTQSDKWTTVTDEEMNEAGISQLSQSLFERLYLRVEKNGWDWAYGLMEQQGRMHQDIMRFPARHFYNDRLTAMFPYQSEKDFLPTCKKVGHSGYKNLLSKQRVIFIDVCKSELSFSKMNDAEASMIHSLLLDLHDLYKSGGRKLEEADIGIITPFRAQIVKIKSLIEALPFKLNVTVDTVERFQGSSLDIVLLSLVVSGSSQISSIVSTGWGGIDRKMNVALTRARDRLIMVGNKKILSQIPYYSDFVKEYEMVKNR